MTKARHGSRVTLSVAGLLVLAAVALTMAGLPADAIGRDYVPDLLTPDRSYEEVPWTYERVEGPHLALHYDNPASFSNGVARVVDADGDDLLHVKASSTVYITDGYDEQGEPRWIPVGWADGRADITLKGSTYVFHHDRLDPVEARLFQDATSGAFADPSTVLDSGRTAETLRERVYGPHAQVTGFREPVDLEDWEVHAPVGEVSVPDASSHPIGWGNLAIDASPELEDLTYVHTPAPEGAFVADASFRPWFPSAAMTDGIPDHQAALAGLSGPVEDPDVDWALVVAHGAPDKPSSLQMLPDATPAIPGLYEHWSLFFIDSDGTRTQVAPTWCCIDEPWHDVRALVDPATGAVEVQVDGNETALRFEDAFTGTSDRIAIGDVIHDHPWWTGGRMGYYDNLAVDPISDQT